MIPQQMEQPIITPFGILASLLWNVFIVNICKYILEVDSVFWRFVIQSIFAAVLHFFASCLSVLSGLSANEMRKKHLPVVVRALARISPIAFAEPVALGWRYWSEIIANVLFQTNGWDFYAFKIVLVTSMAIAAETLMNANHERAENKRKEEAALKDEPVNEDSPHHIVEMQQLFFLHTTCASILSNERLRMRCTHLRSIHQASFWSPTPGWIYRKP